MKGVTRGLYSAPWNINNSSPASYMYINEQHSVCICIMTRRPKSSHFIPTLIHFHASYFNKLLLQIEDHRPQTHSVSASDLEDEKLSKSFLPMSDMVGVIHVHASP